MSVQTQDRLALILAAKSEAEANTEKLMVSIDRATKAIQSMMQQLHGGRWRIAIDRDAGFILVAPRGEPEDKKPIAKPKRGEAA